MAAPSKSSLLTVTSSVVRAMLQEKEELLTKLRESLHVNHTMHAVRRACCAGAPAAGGVSARRWRCALSG